jgi:hypothetical protein
MNNKDKNLKPVDLNIDKYNIHDLEKIFGFLNRKYNKSDIEHAEYKIIQQVRGDNQIPNNFRNELILFYSQAKQKIINSMELSLPPTTFQHKGREQLDDKSNIWLSNEPGSYSGGVEYGRPGSTLDIFNQKSARRDQNEVVRHYDKDFINTNTSDVYAGVINPLNTRFINKYLTIDSRFRDTPYANSSLLVNSTSNFTINLPDKISQVISMQLTSLEIPITYYANSSYIGNNYMIISIKDISNNITSKTLGILDGTYTPTMMATTINTNLTALDGLFKNISISYNSVNGHFTISTTSPSILYFNIDFIKSFSGDSTSFNKCKSDNPTNCNPEPEIDIINYTPKNPINVDLTRRLGYSLGFLSGIYENLKSYTGESVANTYGSRYIFLAIDDFNTNVVSNQFIAVAKHNITSKNILARITVGNGGFLSVLNENDFKIITEPRKYFGPVDITRLRVQLYDDYGLLLNMNRSDFSFNLLLQVVYDL